MEIFVVAIAGAILGGILVGAIIAIGRSGNIGE